MSKVLKEHQVANPIRTEIELSQDVKAIDEKISKDPHNAPLWMERGLALAKMKLMRESVEAFSKAISLEPFTGIYYRHRAHRHLSCWEFHEACADFVVASRIIPENWDVWYHLGLSYFLLGQYEKAITAYKRCYEISRTDADIIPVTDWYWMTLMRIGRKEEATKLLDKIHENMSPGGSAEAYYRRLLMYKGIIKPEELLSSDVMIDSELNVITQGFGLSNYYYIMGDMGKSNEMIERILKAGDENWWSAFGYLAAMVDKKNRGL